MNKEFVEDNDEVEIDLVELFHVIAHRWWIILISLLVGALVAGLYTVFFVTPMYKAKSTIYILGSSSSVISVQDLQIGSQLTSDYQELIKKRTVIEEVIKKLDLDMTYEQLRDSVQAANAQDTRFIEISVTNPDPELARDIANEVAETTINKVALVMKTDKPTLVESAVIPKTPVSPSFSKNIILGGLLLAILAIGVIVVRYLLDDTIKTEEDVIKYTGLNTLASLPDTKETKRRR